MMVRPVSRPKITARHLCSRSWARSMARLKMPAEIAEQVTNAVTQVYESCNFQDITGQRITKVVKALKHIEDRVDALVAAFGDEIHKYREQHPTAEPQKSADEKLLNGPQMPDEASKQAEIDALLASFD